MSEPAPEKEQVGSEAWEAKRRREIRELREKEREKAAEYKQKKEAGLLQDIPIPAPSRKFPLAFGGRLSSISILVAIFGLAVFGSMYVEVPAVIIALWAIGNKERGAWTALLICCACLVGTVFFSFIIGRFFV
jgi:hypothetical protein